jgi:hypothetical protein
MKYIRLVALVLIVGMMGVGCGSTSSSLESLASNPMISSLTSGLGLTANQAIGGAGALLGIAKSNLTSDNFKKVADAVPGASSIMDSGLKMGGLSEDKVKSLADLSGSLGKMSLTQDQVTSMVPAMGDFMTKGGNTEAADLFKGAIK